MYADYACALDFQHLLLSPVGTEGYIFHTSHLFQLQESLADYIIFWDDDITPAAQCLAAYVQAMMQQPQVTTTGMHHAAKLWPSLGEGWKLQQQICPAQSTGLTISS